MLYWMLKIMKIVLKLRFYPEQIREHRGWGGPVPTVNPGTLEEALEARRRLKARASVASGTAKTERGLTEWSA